MMTSYTFALPANFPFPGGHPCPHLNPPSTTWPAMMTAQDDPSYIISLSVVKRWCMPFTFAVMTVLAVFVALLLIRTRVGLIYEVAKMNVLLGLPIGRVKRIQPLSIFFIMQAMVSLGGGCSAGILAALLLHLADINTLPSGRR